MKKDYSLILSFVITVLSVELLPLNSAIIIIKTITPPTIHIQGCILAGWLVVVVVVEEELELEVSCARTTAWISVKIAIIKNEQ